MTAVIWGFTLCGVTPPWEIKSWESPPESISWFPLNARMRDSNPWITHYESHPTLHSLHIFVLKGLLWKHKGNSWWINSTAAVSDWNPQIFPTDSNWDIHFRFVVRGINTRRWQSCFLIQWIWPLPHPLSIMNACLQSTSQSRRAAFGLCPLGSVSNDISDPHLTPNCCASFLFLYKYSRITLAA